MPSLLEAALARARAGEAVLPIWWTHDDGTCDCPKGQDCKSPGKHPLTKNGLDDASVDDSVVKSWWGRWPRANLGVRTDDVPRIDIDALDVAEALAADVPLHASTELVRTPRGGLHIALAVASPVASCALFLADGRRIGELKAARAYVVAPPSVIGDKKYQRIGPASVVPMKVGDPLAWFADVLPAFGYELSRSGSSKKTYRDLEKVLHEGEGRHDALVSYAGKTWVEGLSPETFGAILQAINLQQCVPPLPDHEVNEIARHFIQNRQPRSCPVDDAVPGWRVDLTPGAAHGLYCGDKRVLDEALVPLEIIEGDGIPVGAFVRVHFAHLPHREVFMPAEAVTSRDPATVLHTNTGIPWTPEDAKQVRRWLSVLLARTPKVSRVTALVKPIWDGDRPLLPGGNLRLLPAHNAGWLAAYGQSAAVTEDEARNAWHSVLARALPHPRLLTVLGAAAISVYLQRLLRDSFIAHIYGDSRRGKTLGERSAMSAFGNPDLLVKTWNTTRIAAVERLATANILPVALDETATAGMKDEVMEAIVFGAVTGVGRSRAAKQGGLRDEQSWNLTILSTGERRLTSVSGLTGAKARILQVQAPLTPDAKEIEEIHELAQSHFGWPLTWLRDQGNAYVDLVDADVRTAEQVLVELATNPVARTLARHLAGCVAGVRALSFWCQADVSLADVLDAGRAVLAEIQSQLEEEGPSAADRLRNAVFEAEARRGWAFPVRGQYDDGKRPIELEGIKQGDWLAVFPTALGKIAKEAGLTDYDPALKELRDRGELRTDADGKHLSRTVRTDSGTTRAYVFRRPEQDADGE